MRPWSLDYDTFVAEQQGLREALCTLGNGFFCARGAFPWEEADDIHYPGTYVAGGYNRLITPIAGRDIVNEDLVNFPNPLNLSFRKPGGDWFRIIGTEVLKFAQSLDLKQGVLRVELLVRDKQGRETTIRTRRFVSMANPHLCGVELAVTPMNWSGRMDFRASLDGRIINAGVKRYHQLNSSHLEPLGATVSKGEMSGADIIELVVQTNQSRLRVGTAARTAIFRGGEPLAVDGKVEVEENFVDQVFSVDAHEGREIVACKVAALYSVRDVAISEPGVAAREAADEAPDFESLLHEHAAEWERLWGRFDLELVGPEIEAQMILRLHIFHLLQTLSHNSIDLDVGVPARGWHGEAYRGHVFWDELFILPFIHLRLPQIAGAALRYRFNRLDKAKGAAARSGLRGAMFPWQSGSDGREESQVMHLNPRSGRWVPDNTYIQRHVGLAVAYNTWNHFALTGQQHFLEVRGAEMILEIARFFAALAIHNPQTDRFEIHRVMGPDEYHDAYPDSEEPGLNNNAYTNVMVAWLMTTALETLDVLDHPRRQEIVAKLGLGNDELVRWEEMSRKMLVPFHDDDIISQFEGYENLAEFDWDGYRAKYGDIHRLDRILEAEGDSANRYKVSKQADVLMLFYLFSRRSLGDLFARLGYTLTDEMWSRNLDYYLARTSNGSTLSYVVHSWVMARTRPEEAWRGFVHALQSDVADIQGGTTQEGIHLGAMSGTVDLVQRGFTGLDLRDGEVHFDPLLPDRIDALKLRIRYRGNWLDVEVSHASLKVQANHSWPQPVPVYVRGDHHMLQPGETHVFALSGGAA